MDASGPLTDYIEPRDQLVFAEASEPVALLPAQTESLLDLLPRHRADAEPRMMKARKFAGRVALAAVCTIPVAELTLGDALSLKVLQVSQELVHIDSPNIEHAVEDGIVGLDILFDTTLVGYAITRSKRLKGAFNGMDEYNERRRKTMSRPRTLISKVANAPYSALGYIGDKFEKLGEKVVAHKSPLARTVGGLVIDSGKVNALGTSSVVLQETSAGNPPDLKRTARLGALMATTWLATAEGVRAVYNAVPPLQPPLDVMAKTFETATTPNNPLSISVLGAVALGLANTGWNIARFHEAREQETVEDPSVNSELE